MRCGRRGEEIEVHAAIGLLDVLGGTIATLMTATIAGVLSQFG